MKTVTIVEISVFERITPLVAGYLQGYAQADPDVGPEYDFTVYSTSVKTPLAEIVRAVLRTDSDIYAVSCYVWNMGLVRKLVAALRAARPQAHIILGGPQVMHHAGRYLDPSDPWTVVCNGEGEQTFTAYLGELTESSPDLSRVEGISFADGSGGLITTAERPRIADLNLIPSPYLGSLFGPEYSVAMLETNRGCPYHCGFCYWGAATNDRVYRFDEERVRDEMSWMARNDVQFLYIADANWGMLGRDVDLSRHLADSAKEHGSPSVVYFSAAKNKPHAVTKIVEMFQGSGLIATQPISLQTLSPTTLRVIDRANIKLQAFGAIQDDLQARGMSSFVELIWPLPGETLASFQDGISTLCGKNAQTIIAYPHLLLHNTPIYRDRDRLGLVCRPAGEGVAEAEIVVQTEDVSRVDFEAGMWFFYAAHALHNTRSLRTLSRYLVERGLTTHGELLSAFVSWWQRQPPGDPVVQFVADSIAHASYYDIGNYGHHIHNVLHEHRSVFGRQLDDFVRSQPWWDETGARAAFEFDVVSRPYIYSNTPLDRLDGPFEFLRVLRRDGRKIGISVDERVKALDVGHPVVDGQPAGTSFSIDHKQMQYPYMATQSIEHNANYCHGMIEKVENISPVWTVEQR